MMNALYGVDVAILNAVSTLKCGLLDGVMPFFSMICNHGEVWLLLAAALLFSRKLRPVGVTMILAMGMGVIAGNLILKPLVGRVRPFDAQGVTLTLISAPLDASFPSGHTLSSVASAAVLMCYDKRWGIPAAILAGIIAFSRLYLYVHYPSDVLFGALLGVAVGLAAVQLMRVRQRHVEHRTLQQS